MSVNWRRRRWWLAGFALAGITCSAWLLLRPSPSLNLFLITLDTTRADRLGCYGAANADTPMLDALAAQGCLFERAYAPVPITLPSHASLMTGLYPPEHGLRINSGKQRLGADIPLLSEQLKRLGYRTGAFIGGAVLDPKYGLDRGFEVYDSRMDEARNSFLNEGHVHSTRAGQRVVDAALNWLRKSSRRPVFCWVHLFDPHTPYSARETEFGERYRERPYDAGIAYVDRQVGRLLDYLQENSLGERTIVIVAGDHGESLGEHQERTHGYTLYNSPMQVPLIIRWPGNAPPIKRISAPVSLVDLFPTLNAILNPGESLSCSGRNLWPACTNADFPAVGYYGESDYGLDEGVAAAVRSVVKERWKYIRSPEQELYDLVDDPREEFNVAERHPEKVKELAEILERQGATWIPRSDPTFLSNSSVEQRKLASLGYAGGISVVSDPGSLPDIKEVLPAINAFIDAQLLMGDNDFSQAAKKLEQVVRDAPHYYQAWFNLGVCRNQLGNPADAVSAFQRVVVLQDNAAVQIALGKVYLSRQQPGKAVPHLERAMQFDAESPEGPFLLGRAFQLQGNVKAARQYYEQALEADVDFDPARQALQQLP